MKNFLRAIIGLSVIMLALSITALSCNKVGDDKSNSGNNSGGSGGGNGGGGNTPPATNIEIKILDENKAIIDPDVAAGDTILINVGGFSGGGRAQAIADRDGIVELVAVPPANSMDDLFEFTITGGGLAGDASAGLVLVDTGNLGNITNFSAVPAPGATISYASGPYRNIAANASTATPDYFPAGLRFFGAFTDKSAPVGNDPDAAPFAFTGYPVGMDTPQVLISCRSVISTIKKTTGTTDVATPDTILTGGQTSKCFGGTRHAADFSQDSWVNLAATTGVNFKNTFSIAVAGIRTDGKKLSEILTGFTGATDDAKVAEFMNELTQDEIKLLAANNVAAYRKIKLKLVTSVDFALAKVKAASGNLSPRIGSIEIIPITDVSKISANKLTLSDGKEYDVVLVNAEKFPPAAASTHAHETPATVPGVQHLINSGNFTKIFDLKVVGGTNNDPNQAGGLVLIARGDWTSFNQFQLQPNIATATHNGGNNNYGYFGGKNFYGVFADHQFSFRTADVLPDIYPFAFVGSINRMMHPLFRCNTTVADLSADKTLAGGETATCYAGCRAGGAFQCLGQSAAARNDWFNLTASDNLPRQIAIGVAAIRSDEKTLKEVVSYLPGADDAARVAAFTSGFSKTDLDGILRNRNNVTAVTKVVIRILTDADFQAAPSR